MKIELSDVQAYNLENILKDHRRILFNQDFDDRSDKNSINYEEKNKIRSEFCNDRDETKWHGLIGIILDKILIARNVKL